MTSIASDAFAGCDELRDVTLPEGLTSIGCNVFTSPYITQITIPSTLSSASLGYYAGYAAFSGCKNLRRVTFAPGTKVIPGAVLYYAESVTEVVIPEGVTEIGDRAFRMTAIASVSLPSSLELIDDKAFWECARLESVEIPRGVTFVGYEAFEGCASLRSVSIPPSVEYIASDAFAGCDELSIYGYEGTYAQTYAEKNSIPFVPINGDYFQYLPSKNAWQFANSGTELWGQDSRDPNALHTSELPRKLFSKVFGGDSKKVNKLYEQKKWDGEEGLCFGYIASAQLINLGRPGLSSWFWYGSEEMCGTAKEDLEKAKSSGNVGDINFLGRFNTRNDSLDMSMCEFVELAHIAQFHPDVTDMRHSLAGVKKTLEKAKEVTESGGQLMIRLHSGEVSHVVLAYRVIEEGGTSKIYVYDPVKGDYSSGPRIASDTEYITIGDAADSISGWVYRFDDSTYMGYSPLSQIGYFDPDVFTTIASLFGTANATRTHLSKDNDSLSANPLAGRDLLAVRASNASVVLANSEGINLSSEACADLEGTGLTDIPTDNGESGDSSDRLFWTDAGIGGITIRCEDAAQPSVVSLTSDTHSLSLSAYGSTTFKVFEENEVYEARIEPSGRQMASVELEGEGSAKIAVSGYANAAVDIATDGPDLVVAGFVGELAVARTDESSATTETIVERCDPDRGYRIDGETGKVEETDVPTAGATWSRLAGDGRYDTMAAIVRAGFAKSDWAVVATGKEFPDALVAASLAGAKGCPVVLTAPTGLSKQARSELERLGVRNAYVMGGTGAVDDKVVAALDDMGIAAERVAGSSRMGTSLETLKEIDELGRFDGTVVVATGYNFADALSIGPWCYRTATPMLLTNKSGRLSNDQVEACKGKVRRVIIVGGDAAVSDEVVTQLGLKASDARRLAGSTRFATSKMIAEWETGEQGMAMAKVAVATGDNFPDALAGAALCGANASPLLLVRNEKSATLELVNKSAGIRCGYVLGGEGAVSAAIMSKLESLTK